MRGNWRRILLARSSAGPGSCCGGPGGDSHRPLFRPAFWWISKRSISFATGLIGLLFAVSVIFPERWPLHLAQRVFGKMPAWWCGALLADLYARRIRISFRAVAPLGALLIGAVAFAI